ncbi:MAG: DUF72 domain-containing protein [Microbacteriaceae bacterium]|nr:DUF72 domain-containing protein [Microbacteriaceae bacterium]MCL2796067.1 DUF72 domain-containing protein [Microbacteriaceae bacterium]
MTANGFRALVGTSSWTKPSWNKADGFYQSDVSKAGELRYFADRIPTVEVNATWHNLQRPATYRRWHDQVHERFVFSIKAWRGITHERPLRGSEREVAMFLASGPLLLREKLGPILWQFPKTFGFDSAVLEAFLAGLPRSVDEARTFIARHGGTVDAELAAVPDRALRHAIEVRNRGFAQPRYLEMLREHDIAAVLTNFADQPIADVVTTDLVYVRFDDALRLFPTGHSTAQLEEHAARIRGWLERADVYFYFDDQDYRTNPTQRQPFDAIDLQRLIGGDGPVPGAGLQTSLW